MADLIASEMPAPDTSEVLTELGRILSGKLFASSLSLGRFFRFIVEETLAGRAGSLKEYTIGVQVFDRGTDFDPRIDPIVRVQARNLRLKLDRYYADGNSSSTVRIALPKGCYVPVFEWIARPAMRAAAAGMPLAVAAYAAAHSAAAPRAGLAAAPASASPSAAHPAASHAEPATPVPAAAFPAPATPPRAATPTCSAAAPSGTVPVPAEAAPLAPVAMPGTLPVWLPAEEQSAGTVSGTAALALPPVERHPVARWQSVRKWVPAAAACAVVAALAGTLFLGVPGRRSATQPPRESEARALYIRGRHLLDSQDIPLMRRGMECFRRAVQLEPKFAAAWAGLADSYDLLSQLGDMPPGEAMPEARTAAQKALDLDPTLAEAHVAMAAIMEAYDWNWKGAEREYLRALELNPDLPSAHLWYGMFLRDQGRLKEAIPELERASRMDPVSLTAVVNLAHAYAAKGDKAAAARTAAIGVDLEPRAVKPFVTMAKPSSKEVAGHVRSLEMAWAENPKDPKILTGLASLYAHSKRREDALAMVDELRALAGERYVPPYEIAKVYMALGDPDGAVPYLEAAYRERSAGMIFLRRSRYASLPKFQEIIARLRLNG